ncbi:MULTISPECIES: hypothetical protein [unclassified Sphingomonas]|uniref:head-tail connector protein n=1 Tax=unclassified Sphingomonas TaxID=196159 RepID=UPI00226A652F|nr:MULTISPECIES: hypothetical protein [unclassified Sphingomonas]
MSGSAVPAEAIAGAIAAAQGYLRLEAGQETGQEAALLETLARAALDLAESFCGQALIARGFEDVLAVAPGWQRLRQAPVARIAGVTGLRAAGAPFVMATPDYALDIDADGIGWVRVIAAGDATQVAVSYTAGVAADWATLPAAVAQVLLLLIAHLFEHREGDSAPPTAVAALWRPYRRLRLGRSVPV